MFFQLTQSGHKDCVRIYTCSKVLYLVEIHEPRSHLIVKSHKITCNFNEIIYYFVLSGVELQLQYLTRKIVCVFFSTFITAKLINII